MVMVGAMPAGVMTAVVASPVAVMAVPPAPVVRSGRAVVRPRVVAVRRVDGVAVAGVDGAWGVVAVSRIRIRRRVVTAVVRAVIVRVVAGMKGLAKKPFHNRREG